jgi:hypothetical protein
MTMAACSVLQRHMTLPYMTLPYMTLPYMTLPYIYMTLQDVKMTLQDLKMTLQSHILKAARILGCTAFCTYGALCLNIARFS